MQRVALLNWKNINQDYDLAKILSSLATSWVVEWLKVQESLVTAWYAFIEVTRAWIAFPVLFQNSENLTINTTGDSKVFVEITQANIDDWSSNAVDWSWIWEIKVATDYPTTNSYIPLASITWWVITDDREFIKLNWRDITWVLWLAKSANIASATTTDLSTATGNYVPITWTASIEGFWTMQAGAEFTLVFAWACTLVHSNPQLQLPTSANITTAAWDIMTVKSDWSGNWRCTSYLRKDGSALTWTPVTKVKFGWDWSDWDLSISSWTTTLSLTDDFLEKNYNNLTISWTAILDITWIAWDNWAIAIIKVKWNLTMSWWTFRMNGQWWKWGYTYWWNKWAYEWPWKVMPNIIVRQLNWNAWQNGNGTTVWAWWKKTLLEQWLYQIIKWYSVSCWGWWGGGNTDSNWYWRWWRWGGVLIIEVWWEFNFTWWTISANWSNWQGWIYWGWWGWWAWWTVFISYETLVSNTWTIQVNWWTWATWWSSHWWGWWGWNYADWNSWSWNIWWNWALWFSFVMQNKDIS